MITREEIEGDIRELNVEIRQLKTEIGVLVDQRSTANEALKVSLDAKISDMTVLMTAKTKLMTIKEKRILFLDQQGNLSSRISIVLSHLLKIIICPISLDISSSPIQVRQGLKVRTCGDSWIVNVWTSTHRIGTVK